MAGSGEGKQKSVLFICLGNICRSPIAEGVFANEVAKRGLSEKWEIDSAAIGSWHIGKPPYWRAQECMKKHNVPYSNTCRQIKKDDFRKYDVIFGMDHENMDDLNGLKPKGSKAKLEMLGSYDPEGVLIIEDPYFEDKEEDFETVYQQCVRCCRAFLDANS